MIGPPGWLLEWSQVIAAAGTVILTALLVVLYKKQQEQLAAQHEAVLEVINYEFDRDDVTVWLSNFGNGVARQIRLTVLVYADTGEHRRRALKSISMKRQDKDGEWTNVIEPGEEAIEFTAEAKIGRLTPAETGRRWISVPFRHFVRGLDDSTELKFLILVQGDQLSGKRTNALVTDTTRGIDPSEFGGNNSLEDMPGVTHYGSDNTFEEYFYYTTFEKVLIWTYHKGIQLLNSIPKINIHPRSPDASGLRLVKREVLKQELRHKWRGLKPKVKKIIKYLGLL